MAQAGREHRQVRATERRARSRLAKLVAFIARANQVARERRALARLGDDALKDFAASRAEAAEEAGKPWWDLPNRDRRAA